MVVNGSLSKTAVNGAAGARSQVSGLVVAVLTVITLLFLTGLFEDLPEATLAAVVIAAVVELVDIGALRGFYALYTKRLGRIYGKAARPDFIAAVAALLGVLAVRHPARAGHRHRRVAAAAALPVVRARTSPSSATSPGPPASTPTSNGTRRTTPSTGIPVLRVEAGLFFANAEAVRRAVKRHARRSGTRGVVLDAEAVAFVDVTAVRMLDELASDLARDGQRLVIAHDVGQVGDLLAADHAGSRSSRSCRRSTRRSLPSRPRRSCYGDRRSSEEA